ncbi:MAG TPA: hypothetical protein PLR41_11895 [Alphaproteobacteria bacterium]|nr:hypothetical protein [Alphaproteobacteria bacterium]
MSDGRSGAERIYALAEPWSVLAIGNFITACCKRNFTALQLLRSPIRCVGRLEGGLATIDVPNWFPVQDAILEVAGGAVYSKLRDLPLNPKAQRISDQAQRIQLDLIRAAVPVASQPVALTYFPWFRFLAEPVGFDAAGRVAAYIAGCFRYLLIRDGLGAEVTQDGDGCRIATEDGLVIDIQGMQALKSLALTQGARASSFDLEASRIQIDRRMFPAAYEAGAEMLKTPDRLANVEMTASGDHLILVPGKGAAHV